MKGRIEKILLYSVCILCIGHFAFSLFQYNRNEVVYVDIGKLTQGFKLKKQMEEEGKAQLYQIKNKIDSLTMIRGAGANSAIDSQIAYGKSAMQQYANYLQNDITAKVWERLNPMLEDFGKKMNCKIIVGANGAGTVLYGSKSIDVTEKAIEFVNERYDGKK